MPASSPGLIDLAPASMQQIQGVGSVVHEIDSRLRIESQAEQRSGSGRRTACIVQQLLGDLAALRSDLGYEAVIAIDRQDVAVRSHDQPKGIVQASTGGKRQTEAGRSGAVEGFRDHRDSVVQTVGDVEHTFPIDGLCPSPPYFPTSLVIQSRAETDARRADDERGDVGALRETGTDHGHGLDRGGVFTGQVQVDTDDGAPIHDFPVGCDGVVEHVGHEQLRLVSVLPCGHVPGAIDQGAENGIHGFAGVVEHDQATGLRGGGCAVRGGQAADDHPSGAQRHERGRQPDAAGALPGQLIVGQLGKQAYRAARSHIDDGDAGALQVVIVVEIAHQDVAGLQIAHRSLHTGDAVGVDVAVRGDRRRDSGDVVKPVQDRITRRLSYPR